MVLHRLPPPAHAGLGGKRFDKELFAMRESEITKRVNELVVEYKASGLPIDRFMTTKLSAVRKDGKKCAETAIATLAKIDQTFASLQQARESGKNRQEWLRDNLEKAIVDSGADKKRDVVGEALSVAISAIGNTPLQDTSPIPFEGSDAVEIVASLDEALNKTAIAPVLASEKEDE